MNKKNHILTILMTGLFTISLGELPNVHANTISHATISAVKPALHSVPTNANTIDTSTSITNSVSSFNNSRQYIFADVPPNYWAYQSISTMTQEKIINGYANNTFKPESPLTREEAAALFNNFLGETPTVMLSSTFSDITSDRWSALAIESVAKKNIISGYGDTTYRPEKYMSRQEFAVVADNYIHYIGYVTEDPTILDDYNYSDQKFIAPWAQDAVRELASLKFLAYNPHSMFNPEKYITRAEATEIAYRMTHTPQALAFMDTIHRQAIESKTNKLLMNTFKYHDIEIDFRNDGAMFWNHGKLYVTFTKENKLKQFGAALATSNDKELTTSVITHMGSYTQADLDNLQLETTYMYNQLEPQGTVISITPDISVSSLILTVDELSPATKKAFVKRFGKKASIQLPPVTETNWSKPVKWHIANEIKAHQ